MTLDDLVGNHTIDARGEYIVKAKERYDEDSLVVLLRIDGTVYAVQEDADDGYRSCMREIRVATDEDMAEAKLAEFAPIEVVCVRRQEDEDLLAAKIAGTEHVLFEIGTDEHDDYYPAFVASWNPPTAD